MPAALPAHTGLFSSFTRHHPTWAWGEGCDCRCPHSGAQEMPLPSTHHCSHVSPSNTLAQGRACPLPRWLELTPRRHPGPLQGMSSLQSEAFRMSR